MTITTSSRFAHKESHNRDFYTIPEVKKPMEESKMETNQEMTEETQGSSQEEDLALGAYLISHLRPYCENCGTFVTPQWRKGWQSGALHRSVLLCNACGLKFHKNQFCPYCHYVYGKEQEKLLEIEQTDWLTCKMCGRWVHSECERENGKMELVEDPDDYHCPGCRKTQVDAIGISKTPQHMNKLFRHEEKETKKRKSCAEECESEASSKKEKFVTVMESC
eukprot:TRINITY_DN7729_c0_g1_i1.p1 TRINITY_DN7729_c0_g1~~TRINITY_DN7729_c0_g1_i1.p1  ORF type:complete len:252 (-),score=50.22 TRINITY_DN7729_c0_g1_i1:131-793(-)